MLLKLFVIVVFGAVVFGDTESSQPSKTTPPPLPPPTTTSDNQTTTPAPTTKEDNKTTTPAPTTKADNKTTTPAPTTKADNKTTTSAPTTKADNKTTTSAPTTKADNKTTTPAPTTKADNKTTTPAPTTKADNKTTTPMTTAKPTPPPPHGNFSLKENGSFCILAQFAATINIHYVEVLYTTNTSNITKDETHTEHVNRTTERDIKVSGDCGRKGNKAMLILSWPKKKSFYELTMDFEKVEAASPSSNKTSWSMTKITFNATLKGNPDFKNASVSKALKFVLSTYNKSATRFHGQVGGNYFCEGDLPITFKNDEKDFTVDSTFEDLRIEPFVYKEHDNFGNNTLECYKDNPTTPAPTTPKKKNNNIVPIAVGCALAGLVLIVLIAYVIGRRKSHSGYEKV